MRRTLQACLALPLFLVAGSVSAATISLDAPADSYAPGDIFIATIRIDPGEDECVNTVAVRLSYPTDILRAQALSRGESLLTLWLPDDPGVPEIDQEKGVVALSGGIPAGYCGRVEGDPGKTNIVAKVVFGVLPGATGKTATASFIDGTTAYLNDGRGTKAPLSTSGASFSIVPATGEESANEWQEAIALDQTPPEIFAIELEVDPQTFYGKHFIVFSTSDKQTGIHHYELLEDDPDRFGYSRLSGEPVAFSPQTSPYVLMDQELKSRVVVRAYDHAGNIQEAILPPQGASERALALSKEAEERVWWYAGIAAIFFVIISAFVYFTMSRRRVGEGGIVDGERESV